MAKDLTALTGLKSAEVSLVNRGANLKKRFPFFKEANNMEMAEVFKAVLETESDGEQALDEIFKKAQLSEKGQSAAKGALRILTAFKDEIPSDVLQKLAKLAGMLPTGKQKEDDEYKYPDAGEKKGKVQKNEMLEKLPEEVKKQLEVVFKEQTAQLEAVKKHAEDVEKQLIAERDARELNNWVEKARKDLSHFPGKSAEELGKSLKSLADINKEMADEQFSQMKAASEALKKSSILREAGSSVAGTAGSGSAWDAIQKAADGIVQKAELGMTREKAIAMVMKQRPDLYQQYLDEHPKQTADI